MNITNLNIKEISQNSISTIFFEIELQIFELENNVSQILYTKKLPTVNLLILNQTLENEIKIAKMPTTNYTITTKKIDKKKNPIRRFTNITQVSNDKKIISEIIITRLSPNH
ncbi:MAG: hypothetical protein PF569_06175 [Candidatus Woesearchaeota archaeon]|jgi:hypothetical protein|nr:hypothetical protein [Candidatus Woesearchaeota archaeon]